MIIRLFKTLQKITKEEKDFLLIGPTFKVWPSQYTNLLKFYLWILALDSDAPIWVFHAKIKI